MEPLENGLDSSAKTRVPKVQKPERWKYLPEQCFPTFWDVSPVNKFFKKIGFAAFWFRVNEGVASGNKGQPIVLVKHTYLFSLLHILNSTWVLGTSKAAWKMHFNIFQTKNRKRRKLRQNYQANIFEFATNCWSRVYFYMEKVLFYWSVDQYYNGQKLVDGKESCHVVRWQESVNITSQRLECTWP